MARGMANNEPTVSQANTPEFESGYERVFGVDRKPVRGRWVMGPDGKLVDAAEYAPEQRALDAPIMAGRFYEGAVATDGTDLGSRAKHREYLRKNGLTVIDDYKEAHQKAAERRERFFKEGNETAADKKQRREDVARSLYELQRKGQGRG